jgi:hypothetical protein
VSEPGPASATHVKVDEYDTRFALVRDRLVRVCVGFVGADDAEDIVHEAFVRGRSRYRQLRDDDLFEAWCGPRSSSRISAPIVHWGHSSACTWPAAVTMTTDAPVPAPGADWPGDGGVLKRVAIDSPGAFRFSFLPEPFVDQEGNFGCTDDLVSDEIAPGQRLTSRFAWDTIGPNGMPPPGGRYVGEATFGYMGRGDLPPDVDPFGRSVAVSVSLDVEAPATVYLSPGQAVDALLAEPMFVELLAEAPRERWTEVRLSWDEETWAFELRLDQPKGALVANVDAITGVVTGVETIAR